MAKSNLRRDFIDSYFTVHDEGAQGWNLEAGTETKAKEEQITTTQDCHSVSIMALGQDLLVHYDPQWAGSWLGGALAGISPTSPYTHHGTEMAGSCGQAEFGGGEEPAEREAILGT